MTMVSFEKYMELQRKYYTLKMYEYENVCGALLAGMQFYYDHGRMMNRKEIDKYMGKYIDKVQNEGR